MFSFSGVAPVPDELIEASKLQHAMLFELAVVRAERFLLGNQDPEWGDCLKDATEHQRRFYDAEIPTELDDIDKVIADHAARNLQTMIQSLREQHPEFILQRSPVIPGLGWIGSGNGDFSLGDTLIEIKHTERNFVSGDFRQVMIYWLLKYAASVANNSDVWLNVLLLNPRRNCALLVSFDFLLRSASATFDRVELYELFRSIAGLELDRH